MFGAINFYLIPDAKAGSSRRRLPVDGLPGREHRALALKMTGGSHLRRRSRGSYAGRDSTRSLHERR